MKQFKLYLVLVLIAFVAFGCSKTPTETTDDAGDTPLTTPQQDTYAQNAQGSALDCIDFAGSFSGGLENWAPVTSTSKSSFGTTFAPKTAPVGWSLYSGTNSTHFSTTATSGWYKYDSLAIPYANLYVKFTNDVWAIPTALVTRVDWELSGTDSSGIMTYEYSAYVSRDSGATILNGGWYYSVSAAGTTSYALFTLTNITQTGWEGVTRTCSGSFNYKYNYAGSDLLTGSFTFTSGAGTGTVSYMTTEIARYVFNADGTAYYTLAGESFATPHAFTW
ncbi:MAG: hypothetical protein Q7U87_00425 [bacterium]|nr:hypothetical protein [bacterium]